MNPEAPQPWSQTLVDLERHRRQVVAELAYLRARSATRAAAADAVPAADRPSAERIEELRHRLALLGGTVTPLRPTGDATDEMAAEPDGPHCA